MRHLINIFIFGLIISLTGCATTAKHYVNQGNYEAAINAAATKLRKHPKKADKHILALETAWKIEQGAILNRIDDLRLEGQPENWVTIHSLYAKLDYYQGLIAPVLPLYIKKEFRNADIELVNVKQELADTKMKAAEYLYARAEVFLATGDKLDAREAYYQFKKVKSFYQSFKDIDAKLDESYNAGQNHILIGYENNTNMIIPQQFMNNLMSYDTRGLESDWTKYTKDQDARDSYDYIIEVHVTNIDIGPEQVIQNQYNDSKQVQDGFQYVLDANGNVAKDTLGNDLKEPRYVTIQATIFQSEQTKVGTLQGVIEYKTPNGQSFRNFPFREDLVFKNAFATFTGNQKALSAESAKKLGGQPLEFPSDIKMVMDASEIVKGKTFDLIRGNTGLVLN